MGGIDPALRLTLSGNPDGALCEAAKMEDDDDGASTAAAGVGDAEGVEVEVDLANGDDPKTDVAFAWSPKFDTTGADVDAPKGEKDGFPESRKLDKTSAVEPEALGTEEVDVEPDVDPKAEVEEVCPKNAEAAGLPPPNAELEPKPRLPPNTFGVVLRFANAEAAGGTEVAEEGAA